MGCMVPLLRNTACQAPRTLAEYSQTTPVVQLIRLRFHRLGSESQIITDQGYARSRLCMRYVDLAVIAGYLVAITWFGARFRSGQKNLRDYFLGGRTAPWWAISLSIVSAETSTLTIIGTPALAFTGNLGFLQIVLGYLLARIVISALFLPHYFSGEMFTAYELMRRRFGERIRKLTASIFLVTRALAEGVRVYAISIVISIVLGTGDLPSIILITLLTVFYTF